MIRKNKVFVVLLLILLLAALLRFYHLGSRPLYADEPGHTVVIAAKSLSFIVTTNYGSILYPLLLHFLLPLGDVAFMARLPAALFGILSVLLVFSVGKLLLGKKEGLLAALFMAVSTYSMFFSQQARGYTGLMLFSLISLYFFLRSLQENKVLFWGLYVFFSVVNTYLNFFALIIIPVHVFFVGILMLEKLVAGRKGKKAILNSKKLAGSAASIVLILVITFFLYLPTKNTGTVNVDFFSIISNSFKGPTTVSLPSLVAKTMKKMLDYSTSSTLFFMKIIFFSVGILACLRNRRRELILLLFYFLIPFVLFILYRPPRLYLTAPDNKFIFMLPMFYLLAARGIVVVYSVVRGTLSRLLHFEEKKKEELARSAVFLFFILLILFLERVNLKDYYMAFWRVRSLDRTEDINTCLKKEVQQEEVIFFEDYLERDTLLMVKPLRYPGGSKKGVMINGLNDQFLEEYLSQEIGLWAVFERSKFPVELPLDRFSGAPEIKETKKHTIVHFRPGNGPLSNALAQVLKYHAHHGPADRETRVEYSLMLAKLYLLAGRTEEAMDEFSRAGRLRFQSLSSREAGTKRNLIEKTADWLFQIKNKDYHRIIQKLLHENTAFLLVEKGRKKMTEGDHQTAIQLKKKAVELLPNESGLYFSLADSYEQMGMVEEAVKAYQMTLSLSRNLRTDELVIEKIRELRVLPAGYIIWSRNGNWHIRWWSDIKRVFSGRIDVSAQVKKVKGVGLNKKDRFELSGSSVVFKCRARNGKIEGMEIIPEKISQLTFELKIDGQEDIQDRIIFPVDVRRPSRLKKF